MQARIIAVDRVRDGLIVTFDDGAAVFFDAEFLYGLRNGKESRLLPAEKDGNKIG